MTGQVKAISLWQPWASLVVHGLKEYETRSWRTRHRGLLAIHAARRKVTRGEFERFADLLEQIGLSEPGCLPAGAIVGFVEVEEVCEVEEVRGRLSERELALGDYADGRYAWRLARPRWLPRSIKMRGRQGIWMADIDVEVVSGVTAPGDGPVRVPATRERGAKTWHTQS